MALEHKGCDGSDLWHCLGVMKREVENIGIDVSRSLNGLLEFDGLFIQETEGKIHLYSGSWNTLRNDMGTTF